MDSDNKIWYGGDGIAALRRTNDRETEVETSMQLSQKLN